MPKSFVRLLTEACIETHDLYFFLKKILVRLLTEACIETFLLLNSLFQYCVRLLTEACIETLYEKLFLKMSKFASSRRRVLKPELEHVIEEITKVRLLTEACIETATSSIVDFKFVVRLLTEACIETLYEKLFLKMSKFASSRRRVLKPELEHVIEEITKVRLLTEACIETFRTLAGGKLPKSSPPHGGVY